MQVLNIRPKREVIEEIALLKSIHPSFVEKDWYVTQVICFMAALHDSYHEMVFSGGTALSKAYGLIQRFSEDIDFKVLVPRSSQNRKSLSLLKQKIIEHLKRTGFRTNIIEARNDNRSFVIHIDYETYFVTSEALRPHIQLEITAENLQLPPISLPISSFVTEVMKQPPEVKQISCVDVVENAADKLSALAWRIPSRIRGGKYDDPFIVRHLHDLAILKDKILNYTEFLKLVKCSMEYDERRLKETSFSSLPMAGKFSQMLSILDKDEEYSREYNRFVKGVSYAPQDSIPSFKAAIKALKQIIGKLL